MSLSVQSRAASSSAIHARDGIAVSMAIASPDRGSARMWTLVPTGPTTFEMRSMNEQASRSRLELDLHAVEGLADHLVGGPLDQPGTHAGQRPGQVHVGIPVHDRRARVSVGQVHLRGRVHSAAGRLAVGLDRGPVGRLLLGELHVDVEPRVDEPDPDLRRRLEMGRVDDLDLLDARAALAHLVGIGDEGPDLLAGRLDRDGSFEVHAVLRMVLAGARTQGQSLDAIDALMYAVGSRMKRVRQLIEQNA